MEPKCKYVFLGLSITSTWGNGHATTFRALLKALAAQGHQLTFLERDVPWYAGHREFSSLPYCRVALYSSLEELKDRFTELVRQADAVVVGSYVPDGISVGRWVQQNAAGVAVFYDIDTPVTISALEKHACEYLSAAIVPGYQLYLSFTGGPTLRVIEKRYGSPRARALYCSVDPSVYFEEKQAAAWDLAYLGTYAADRQPALLFETADGLPEAHFAEAGSMYPQGLAWPSNVKYFEHVPATEHRKFYNSQRFTLNLTRHDMIRAGYSPSVRLFEAAACAIPIISDSWPGLNEFFEPGREILLARNSAAVIKALSLPDAERTAIGRRAQKRVLRFHTAEVRAREFDSYIRESLSQKARSKKLRTDTCKTASPALA